MAKKVQEINVLRDYLRGVVHRADHHAQGTNEIALAIAGAVVLAKDDHPIKVMTRNGQMTNVLWFNVGGSRYALSYNHATDEIELKDGSLRGETIEAFSNKTTIAEVRAVFGTL